MISEESVKNEIVSCLNESSLNEDAGKRPAGNKRPSDATETDADANISFLEHHKFVPVGTPPRWKRSITFNGHEQYVLIWKVSDYEWETYAEFDREIGFITNVSGKTAKEAYENLKEKTDAVVKSMNKKRIEQFKALLP